MNKLPVIDVTGRAMRAPVRFFWPLAPFYLVLQIGVVGVLGAFATIGPETGLGVEPANLPLAIAAGIVLFIASIMLVVLTHRLVAGVADPWRLAGPAVGYVALSLGILAIVLATLLVLGALSGLTGAGAPVGEGAGEGSVLAGVLALVIYVGFIVFFVRASLALPAAALEREKPLLAGLAAGRGNTLRLIGGWLLLMLFAIAFAMAVSLLAALLGLVEFPPQDQGAQGLANALDLTDPDALAMLGINVAVNYAVTVATTAFLTHSLMAIEGRTPAE